MCRSTVPCLIQARYSHEPADAIPTDQIFIDTAPASGGAGTDGEPAAPMVVESADASQANAAGAREQQALELLLPRGEFHIQALDAAGKVLRSQVVVVGLRR